MGNALSFRSPASITLRIFIECEFILHIYDMYSTDSVNNKSHHHTHVDLLDSKSHFKIWWLSCLWEERVWPPTRLDDLNRRITLRKMAVDSNCLELRGANNTEVERKYDLYEVRTKQNRILCFENSFKKQKKKGEDWNKALLVSKKPNRFKEERRILNAGGNIHNNTCLFTFRTIIFEMDFRSLTVLNTYLVEKAF